MTAFLHYKLVIFVHFVVYLVVRAFFVIAPSSAGIWQIFNIIAVCIIYNALCPNTISPPRLALTSGAHSYNVKML